MLVVLDAGVWVSAMEFGGLPLTALRIASVKHRLASCQEIDAEVERTLERKFKWPTQRTRREMDEYLHVALRIAITGVVKGICRDPKDDMVLECAALVRADLIVSGDQDLLALERYERTLIVTPRRYVDEHWDPAIA